jgi:hypothetical protein
MNATVSQILNEKHNIEAGPGQKVECPFCHHKTLAVKCDDNFAKCFHPSCGRFITTYQQANEDRIGIYTLLEEFYQDSHRALLEQEQKSGKTAYAYLVKERRIHPNVVNDSMLGIVPRKYDLNSKFTPLIEKAESSDQEENKGAKESTKDRLAFISEVREKFAKCIDRAEDWLCFFYTNAHHNIIAIRFREPYSKRILYFKPFKTAGLFGHGLFTPTEIEKLQEYSQYLIVTEGEFNQLQLQTLLLRFGETTKENMGYLFACSVGGVGNADFETIKKVASHPIICYDNDLSGAGLNLVEKARQMMTVDSFTTSGSDSDLDNFIREYDNDYRSAWNAVRKLIADRKTHFRDYASLALEIFTIRKKHGTKDTRKDFEINAQVGNVVTSDLSEKGSFYYEGQRAYFHDGSNKKLVEVHPEDIEFTLLLSKYGINRSESLYRYLYEALLVNAFESGSETRIHRLAYYDQKTFKVYLFNFGNQIYKISPEKTELVDNGTDGVLFVSDGKSQPFELNGHDRAISLLDKFIISKVNFDEGVLKANEYSLLLLSWFYCLFFESIMPTKPILAFIGPKGSGKSHTVRKIGRLLFGDGFDVMPLSNDVKDFDAAVTNSALVAIDNADTKSNWLNDRLATVATGGIIRRRKYYTTNSLEEIPTHSYTAITARTPQFNRDDVADRLLIMRVGRIGNFISESVLLDEVMLNRNRIMSEVVEHIQEILRARKSRQQAEKTGTFRMADFADFSLRLAHSAGFENHMRTVFDKLSNEQSYFSLENDEIVELLSIWSEKNPDKEVTNSELCDELSDLAKEMNIKFKYTAKNRAFAQRMAALRPNMKVLFEIDERPAGGHTKVYKYTPKQGN